MPVKIVELQKLNPSFPLSWPIKKRTFIKWYWEYKCVYCFQSAKKMEIDHVIPRYKGGSNHASNLVPACHFCNQAKWSKSLEEFCPDPLHREYIRLNALYCAGLADHLWQKPSFNLNAYMKDKGISRKITDYSYRLPSQ